MLFIVKANSSQHGVVQKELENDYVKKINSYRTTIDDAMNLLLNHKEVLSQFRPNKPKDGDNGVLPSQRQEKPMPDIDGKLFPNIERRKCKCLVTMQISVLNLLKLTLFQMGLNFNQVSFADRIQNVSFVSNNGLKHLILLDCASTVHFLCLRTLKNHRNLSFLAQTTI